MFVKGKISGCYADGAVKKKLHKQYQVNMPFKVSFIS